MNEDAAEGDRGGILMLGMVSLVAGAATGLVGTGFRVCLRERISFEKRLLFGRRVWACLGLCLSWGCALLLQLLRRGWCDGFRRMRPGVGFRMSKPYLTKNCRRLRLC